MIAALVINIAEPMRISVTHFKKLGRPEDSAKKWITINKRKKKRRNKKRRAHKRTREKERRKEIDDMKLRH